MWINDRIAKGWKLSKNVQHFSKVFSISGKFLGMFCTLCKSWWMMGYTSNTALKWYKRKWGFCALVSRTYFLLHAQCTHSPVAKTMSVVIWDRPKDSFFSSLKKRVHLIVLNVHLNFKSVYTVYLKTIQYLYNIILMK